MDFITIDVINIKQQHPLYQDTITLFMTPIINSYFNKHPISWEIIHCHILHPSESVMKAMWRLQTPTGLPKHCPNKLNQSPCTICYKANMTNLPKVTTVDTNNLQPGELFHIYYSFYNVTSIRVFTYVITVIYAKNILL